LVLGVFVVSIGSVILPQMSQYSALDDMDKFKELYVKSIVAVLFMTIPAAVILTTVGYPIISVLFMRNEFTSWDAMLTYRALFYSALGLVSVSVLRLTTPAFYALKDTKTPVITSAISMVLTLLLGLLLMRTPLLHAGLMLALSISTTVQVIILIIVLRKRLGKLGFSKVISRILKIIAASYCSLMVMLYISRLLDWDAAEFISKLLVLAALLGAGGITYLIVCYVLKVPEFTVVVNRLFKP
jgi:putative peptidoglycan lipid II flippase